MSTATISEAEQALRATSDEALLRTFAMLTHRVHGADSAVYSKATAAALRAQRDLVQAEVLRRMSADTADLIEGADLLASARYTGSDPGNAPRWGKRRKALQNRAIDAGWRA